MSKEEFALMMTAHQRWNTVESVLTESGMWKDDYIQCVKVQRKQLMFAMNNELNFEISEFAIMIPNSGPYAPVEDHTSLSCGALQDSNSSGQVLEKK